MTTQEENNNLLKFVLSKRYFEPWREWKKSDFDEHTSLISESNLEIFFTTKCNQRCEYCYLHKYKGLYPSEFDKEDLVLHNLKLLYDWVIDQEFFIPTIEFFSGEIWHTDYGRQALRVTLDAIKNGMRCGSVLIPTNATFLREEESFFAIQNFIDEFNENGVRLTFSLSIDGAVIENINRPLNDNSQKDDEFYDKCFIFAKHNGFYFHPMVAAYSVEHWIDNYKWFEEKFHEYDMNINELMMLEVRNDDWTDEAIEHYNEFMDYLIDETFRKCDNNPNKMAMVLIGADPLLGGGYVPFAMSKTDTFAGCTVANDMTVRLGDLAICPCHRTAYNKFLYGWLKVEDDKIVAIEANNPQMAVRVLMGNNQLCHFGCDTCKYVTRCMQGCYGSQLESQGDPFMPIPSVCKFFKKKINHLLRRYKEIGVMDVYKNISPYSPWYVEAKSIVDYYNKIFEDGEV